MTERLRVHVRCDTCKYPTSKAKREDGHYGPCPRCVGILRACQPKPMKDAHMHVLTPESRVLDSLDDTRSTDFAQVLRRSGLTASRCREALDTLIKLHLVSRVHYRTKYLYQKRKGQTVAA